MFALKPWKIDENIVKYLGGYEKIIRVMSFIMKIGDVKIWFQ